MKSREHTENTHIQVNSPFAANKFHLIELSAFTTDTSSQLNIFWHDLNFE